MQEQNRRRLEWNAIATKLLEIERNANVGATPAAAADGNVSLLVEQNFQLVMRKAARLMCPQVTLDTFFFAVDLHKVCFVVVLFPPFVDAYTWLRRKRVDGCIWIVAELPGSGCS